MVTSEFNLRLRSHILYEYLCRNYYEKVIILKRIDSLFITLIDPILQNGVQSQTQKLTIQTNTTTRERRKRTMAAIVYL